MKQDIVKQTRIMDEKKFLMLVRENWRSLPQLLRICYVKDLYRKTGSIRKTARLLGLGKSTVHHYLKHYRDSTFPIFSRREQMLTLEKSLNDIYPLLQNADPAMYDGTSDHLLLLNAGDDA